MNGGSDASFVPKRLLWYRQLELRHGTNYEPERMAA